METMLAERVKEGQQEWLEQGEASVLLRLMERKFGPEATEAHRERIEAADAETLLQWSEPDSGKRGRVVSVA